MIHRLIALLGIIGTEKKTGRVVAIKKIRIGQFKLDGLDLSAIR
jgi:hypothetical protein